MSFVCIDIGLHSFKAQGARLWNCLLGWNLAFNRILKLLERLIGQKFVAQADDLIVILEANSRIELERLGKLDRRNPSWAMWDS